MEYIKLTSENLENEHICCAISNNKDIQVSSKKEWLKERLKEGLVFLKGNIRGKCFIEYIPAEFAWCPIEAKNYMFINCLWVSGQYKGQGYSNDLVEECIKDSKQKGKSGLAIISSKTKMGFLSDRKYLQHKGFELCDTANPYFELWYLPFSSQVEKPKFKECVNSKVEDDGFTIYYTNQCPFTAKYVPILENYAKSKNVPIKVVHINDRERAQNSPLVFTTFALFYNGKFITHEILSENKFEKIINEQCV